MRTLILVLAALAAAGVATAAPPELATSNLNTPAGKLTALTAKTVYQASSFPLGLRLTAPDGTWGGAQWTTSSRGKKTFAWAAVGRGGTTATSAPKGVITIITAIGPTPSVSATVARIHQGGSGITFQKPSAARVAGYTGTQFDGNVWGSSATRSSRSRRKHTARARRIRGTPPRTRHFASSSSASKGRPWSCSKRASGFRRISSRASWRTQSECSPHSRSRRKGIEGGLAPPSTTPARRRCDRAREGRNRPESTRQPGSRGTRSGWPARSDPRRGASGSSRPQPDRGYAGETFSASGSIGGAPRPGSSRAPWRRTAHGRPP